MDIKLEILEGTPLKAMNTSAGELDSDTNDVINSMALNALGEIKKVIQNEKIENDFDVVEEIVCIFEKYNIDAGARHNFG